MDEKTKAYLNEAKEYIEKSRHILERILEQRQDEEGFEFEAKLDTEITFYLIDTTFFLEKKI